MARLVRDDIDKFFDYEIYIPTRTLYIGSVDEVDFQETGVNSAMAERTIKALHILESTAPAGDKPITIIMNNPGGDWYHGMAIYDAIKACKNHVTIIVYGMAMSMGAVILQAGDDRVLAPNARVMVHYGTDAYSGHAKDFQQWAKEADYLRYSMEKLFLEKIRNKNENYSLLQLKELLDFDTFLNATEAIELGLADRVQ